MASLPRAAQRSLLSFIDPAYEPMLSVPVLGETFEVKADGERLGSQQRRVEELMQDGEWRTLHEIAIALRKLYKNHFPEASISARLRDLRRAGYTVERERVGATGGQWKYRARKAGVAA